jgi:long-chain acyl-CoA synthetase
MNLFSAFAQVAADCAGHPAVFWGDAEYSYARILALTQGMASRLREAGQRQAGGRVGILLKNCPEYIPALLGTWLADGVAVPINSFLKFEEVAFLVKDSGLSLLITDAAHRELRLRLADHFPALTFIDLEETKPMEGPLTAPASSVRGEADLAVIIYTSGTTGRPKGAMLSHGNLLHNVESCRQVLAAVDSDRFVLLLPMFHSFMLCVCILLPLMVGGSIVLIKSLHPSKNVIGEIVARQATLLPAIPQFFRTMADAPNLPPLPLRLCISGAAPLPVQLLKDFTARFAIPLLEGYGLSEASPVVAINPVAGPWKAGSIGRPIPQVEVSVQDDAGRKLGPGEIGEICVRGGNVMQGYWNQPEASAEALRQGWLLTGDIGYQDKGGYFYITDRKKDMLLVNGLNVYPREIEEVIYQYPGVKEAAVVGQPDPRRGEQPVAYIAGAESVALETQGILQFLRERLADYKVPRRLVILPALPRNETGKILKTELRKLPF